MFDLLIRLCALPWLPRPLAFLAGQLAFALLLAAIFVLAGCDSPHLGRALVPRLQLQGRLSIRSRPGHLGQVAQLRAVAIFGERLWAPSPAPRAAAALSGADGGVVARCAQDPRCLAQLAELSGMVVTGEVDESARSGHGGVP